MVWCIMNKQLKIHFIGIGGISMSALAKLALIRGQAVSGSDAGFSEELLTLTEAGADAYVGHDPSKARSADLVVYSGAIKDTDPELVSAREALVPTVERQFYLQEIAKGYDKVIAVAGTHGKTTVCGMLASVFATAGLPFTAHIGGYVNGYSNLIYRGEAYFLTEACEYRRSFLALTPDYSIITNVDLDHPDTYASQEEVEEAFEEFRRATKLSCITQESGYLAKELKEHKNCFYGFRIYENGNPITDLTLNVPGLHNVQNATLAFGLCKQMGLPVEVIARGLSAYKGTKRRFEYISDSAGKIYSDYAHHPAEIRATLSTARGMKPKRLVVVFQPHTFSRTAKLYDEFLTAFSGVDMLYIFKTYSARETEADGVTARKLYEGLTEFFGDRVAYFDSMVTLAGNLIEDAKEDDLLIIMGAGDIENLTKILE